MSRVGRRPIPLPQGVRVDIQGSAITVTGPRGVLSREIHSELQVLQEDGVLTVARPSDSRQHRALHGLTRTLIANMVEGVSQGFRKELDIVGVGYRAQETGGKLIMQLGFSHPVEVTPPPGITFAVAGTTRVVVSGIDKERVGQEAANLRAWRKPEPYKGKGIRYINEVVLRKAGKGGKVGGKKGR